MDRISIAVASGLEGRWVPPRLSFRLAICLLRLLAIVNRTVPHEKYTCTWVRGGGDVFT